MSYFIWSSPRESFCWLDATKVIAVSTGERYSKGHCELVDIVNYKKTGVHRSKITNSSVGVDESVVYSVAKM